MAGDRGVTAERNGEGMGDWLGGVPMGEDREDLTGLMWGEWRLIKPIVMVVMYELFVVVWSFMIVIVIVVVVIVIVISCS